MNKIYVILLVLLVSISSCKKLDEMNVNPKQPTAVPGKSLATSGMKSLGDQVASTNVNINVFRLWIQYWTETTYTDETNYDIKTRGVPDNVYSRLYKDALSDLTEASIVIAGETVIPGTESEIANQLAIIDLLQVYAYARLVDIFGNVPYSQAIKVEETLLPSYDDAFSIYKDLVARIDNDIANLDEGAPSFGSADLIYGGAVTNWKAFAYSLKLRMGMMLVDFDPTLSKQWVEDAAPNVFASNGQDATIEYLTSTPNTNPVYVDLVLSGRQDFVAAAPVVNVMNALNDPRRMQYFTLDPNGGYSGGGVGDQNTFGDFSKPGTQLTQPTLPVVFLSYSEMQFYLAEAVERGYAVGGSAEGYYNEGILSSILYWGGTQDEYDAYIAQSDVAYSTAPGDFKEKIGLQSWIAFYNRGFAGYTQWRRLDKPDLQPAAAPVDGVFPVRYTYPINEQTLNGTNYTAAASAIGGDLSDTKIFWDVN